MKKSLSYLLPLAAFVLLAIIGIRWLNARNNKTGEIPLSAEGIEISDLTGEEQATLGVMDAKAVELTAPESSKVVAKGEIRVGEKLETTGRTPFTLTAQLPELKTADGYYQVWFEGEKGPKKASRLVREKGGYVLDGAISSEFNSVKVIVSKEKQDDTQIEEVVLEGNLDL